MSELNNTESFKRLELFEKSLKKYRSFDIFNNLGTWASIIGLIFVFVNFEQWNINSDQATLILFAIFGTVIIVLSFILLRFEFNKRPTYSEVIQHIHFVNHASRDFISNSSNYDSRDFDVLLAKILGAISESFSLTTRRKCGASIKLLQNTSGQDKNYPRIQVRMEDDVVKNRRGNNLETNFSATEFSSVSAFLNNTETRYYICNNIPKAYSKRLYDHPYIKLNPKKPKVLLQGLIPLHWSLKIRATVVVPIRFFNPKIDKDDNLVEGYIGFLCIDAESRNIFNDRYSTELAAAYADVLYLTLLEGQKNNLL